jgi:hypothetical protein
VASAALDASDLELHTYSVGPHVPDVLVSEAPTSFGSGSGLFREVLYDPGNGGGAALSPVRPDAVILRTRTDVGRYLALGIDPEGVHVAASAGAVLQSLRLIGGRSGKTFEVWHE